MKFGLKTFYDEKLLDYFEGKIDFFEVMAVRGRDYSFLKKYKTPIMIHAEHEEFNVNPVDKNLSKINLESLRFAQRLADSVNAKKIVFHLGAIKNSSSSKENALDFLKKNKDKRIVVENLFEIGSVTSTPEDMKELKQLGFGFCLDLNHAYCYANKNKLDYYKFIKEFIEMKPEHYHFGGDKLGSIKDQHLSIKESGMDTKKILNLLPKDAEVTLETKPDIKSKVEDFKIVEKWKG